MYLLSATFHCCPLSRIGGEQRGMVEIGSSSDPVEIKLGKRKCKCEFELKVEESGCASNGHKVVFVQYLLKLTSFFVSEFILLFYRASVTKAALARERWSWRWTTTILSSLNCRSTVAKSNFLAAQVSQYRRTGSPAAAERTCRRGGGGRGGTGSLRLRPARQPHSNVQLQHDASR